MSPKKFVIGIRALIFDKGQVLVVKQRVKGNKFVYLLPGGGLHPGESIIDGLKREVREETGLNLAIEKLVYINEMVSSYDHNIEFFFLAKIKGGKLHLGYDPEYDNRNQKLEKVSFIELNELNKIPFYPEKLRSVLVHDYEKGFHEPVKHLGVRVFSEKEYQKIFGKTYLSRSTPEENR